MLALDCCKAHVKIDRKIENLIPCKIIPWKFQFKLCLCDYITTNNVRTNFGTNRFSGVFFQVGDIKHLVDFLDRPVLPCPFSFLGHMHKSNCWTNFRTLWLKRHAPVKGGSFSGLGRWIMSCREKYAPKLPESGREYVIIGQNAKI